MGCIGFLRRVGAVGCRGLLGGSWDLVSKVISTLIGVISIVTLTITLVTKSHDPLSKQLDQRRGALVLDLLGWVPFAFGLGAAMGCKAEARQCLYQAGRQAGR